MLSARALVRRYGPRPALDGVDLDADADRLTVVVGPSGAGKSTLLRLLAGLERPDAGTIALGGRDLRTVPTERRGIALVFQQSALFPHMNVEANLRFALRGADRSIRRFDEAVEMFGIARYLGRRPRELSGGERQVVALARAYVANPLALLLDEPFAHLDPPLRAQMAEQLVDFRLRFSGCIVHVTHDHHEAMRLGDRLVVLIDGRVAQVGAPQQIYDRPANLSVARFFGTPRMNLLRRGAEVHGVRPERILIDTTAPDRAVVVDESTNGADRYLRLRGASDEIVARIAGVSPAIGDDLGWRYDLDRTPRYDAVTGELLP